MSREMMTHVERIVRPVRARQSWKLRARRELLLHLELAYAEELARDGDAAGALARAKARLGEPAELTRRLTETVPVVDRMLFLPMPAPRGFNRWEREAARWMGLDAHPMTSHGVVTLLTTIWWPYMAGIAMALMVDRSACLRALRERPMEMVLFNVMSIGVMIVLWRAAGRVMRRFSTVDESPRVSWLVGPGALFLGCLMAIAAMCVVGMSRRPLTAGEVGRVVVVTVMLVGVLAVTARLLAAHRRRYEPWLSLDVAV